MCHQATDKGLVSELDGLKDGIMIVLRSISFFPKAQYFCWFLSKVLLGSGAGAEFIKQSDL